MFIIFVQIVKILAGKVVVGHAIHNDFKALTYSHPAGLTRDTSRIPLLNKKAGLPEKQAVSLKRLAKALLNQDIQVTGQMKWDIKGKMFKNIFTVHSESIQTTFSTFIMLQSSYKMY